MDFNFSFRKKSTKLIFETLAKSLKGFNVKKGVAKKTRLFRKKNMSLTTSYKTRVMSNSWESSLSKKCFGRGKKRALVTKTQKNKIL